MIAFTRRYRFPAAHVLASRHLSPDENARVFGKCSNPAGHGHDYALEVTVSGAVDARSGQILAREQLDRLVQQRVLARFAYRMLNEDPVFEERVPTAENICRVVHEALEPEIARSGARLVRVRVDETRRNGFACGALR